MALKNEIDFVGKKKLAGILSAIVILVSVLFIIIQGGLNYNIGANHGIYVNAGVYSRQPFHDNLYLNYRRVMKMHLSSIKCIINPLFLNLCLKTWFQLH